MTRLTRPSPQRAALRLGATVLALAAISASAAEPPRIPADSAATPCPAVLDHTMPRLQDDTPQNLCQYAGKVVLVVNTASKCGYTRQYEALEKLHERYSARGLVVLGFPSNDFGNQEPGSNQEIAEFCENTFGVRFPMLAKSSVTGPQANPVFAALIAESGTAPGWNFHKYLLDREGQLVANYSSKTSPLDRSVLRQIDEALATRKPGS